MKRVRLVRSGASGVVCGINILDLIASREDLVKDTAQSALWVLGLADDAYQWEGS